MSNIVLIRLRESHSLVGLVEEKTDEITFLSAMAVIRYWGTTKGFPELCAGPTAKTILDIASLPPGCLAEITRLQVLYALPAHENVWRRALNVGL